MAAGCPTAPAAPICVRHQINGRNKVRVCPQRVQAEGEEGHCTHAGQDDGRLVLLFSCSLIASELGSDLCLICVIVIVIVLAPYCLRGLSSSFVFVFGRVLLAAPEVWGRPWQAVGSVGMHLILKAQSLCPKLLNAWEERKLTRKVEHRMHEICPMKKELLHA